ncbi:MAG: PIN domain-containing protein [Chloroflexota bacterium]
MTEGLLDANMLLRLLTNEPQPLAERTAILLAAAEQQQIALVVAPLILAEVVYVLQSVYKWPRTDIAQGMLEMLAAPTLVVLEPEVIAQTLRWYGEFPRLDFADAYIAALAAYRGHGVVFSFDHDLRRLPGIRPIEDAAQLPSIRAQ